MHFLVRAASFSNSALIATQEPACCLIWPCTWKEVVCGHESGCCWRYMYCTVLKSCTRYWYCSAGVEITGVDPWAWCIWLDPDGRSTMERSPAGSWMSRTVKHNDSVSCNTCVFCRPESLRFFKTHTHYEWPTDLTNPMLIRLISSTADSMSITLQYRFALRLQTVRVGLPCVVALKKRVFYDKNSKVKPLNYEGLTWGILLWYSERFFNVLKLLRLYCLSSCL